MAISPFPARPGAPDSEGRRARLVLALATLGIAASLLAYAISPSVRHAVGHAAHSVRHAVGNVFDRDRAAHHAPPARTHVRVVRPAPSRAHTHVHAPAPRSATPRGATPGSAPPRTTHTATAPG